MNLGTSVPLPPGRAPAVGNPSSGSLWLSLFLVLLTIFIALVAHRPRPDMRPPRPPEAAAPPPLPAAAIMAAETVVLAAADAEAIGRVVSDLAATLAGLLPDAAITAAGEATPHGLAIPIDALFAPATATLRPDRAAAIDRIVAAATALPVGRTLHIGCFVAAATAPSVAEACIEAFLARGADRATVSGGAVSGGRGIIVVAVQAHPPTADGAGGGDGGTP